MLKTLPHYRGKSLEGTRISIVSSEEKEITISSFLCGATLALPRILIRTGLETDIPEGYGLMIVGIAGLCHSRGLTSISPQILTKESYGEIKIVVVNFGATPHTIYPGDRIAEAIKIRLGG